jgi:LuxR family transcriptional regulator, quorum-sensing system regulator SolR
LYRFIKQMADVHDDVGLKACLAHAAGALGFSHFCYCGVDYSCLTARQRTVLSNYPEGLLDAAYAPDALDAHPTFARGKLLGEPLVWNKALFEKQADTLRLLKSKGLAVGWRLTVLHHPARVGTFELARAKPALSEQELTEKTALFRAVADAFEYRRQALVREAALADRAETAAPDIETLEKPALAAPQAWDVCPLTARELAVLRWTADGKTADDIAQILQISSRTVSFHLGNTMLLLGAPNKTAAVSRALLAGWLY